MRKINLPFVLFLIAAFFHVKYLRAQRIHAGIQTGIDFNRSPVDLTDRVNEKNGGVPGFYINIPILYQLSERIGLNSGIGIVYKNYQTYRTALFSGVYENSINQYLQFPVTINIQIWQINKLKISLGTGFYFAYLLSAWRHGKIPNLYNSDMNFSNGQSELILTMANYSERENFTKKVYKRYEIGGAISSNIQYSISKQNILFFEVNYWKSFTSKQYSTLGKKPAFNSTIVFSMGIFHNIYFGK